MTQSEAKAMLQAAAIELTKAGLIGVVVIAAYDVTDAGLSTAIVSSMRNVPGAESDAPETLMRMLVHSAGVHLDGSATFERQTVSARGVN